MSMLRVRISEGNTQQANLLWDSQWRPQDGAADWALAGAGETQNRGGLRSLAALHTAIILLLFTDKRIPDNHPLLYLLEGGDQRGWWGDGSDVDASLSETELGSLLWVFERSILTEDIRRWVEAIALDALSPLIKQGAATRIDAQASAEFALDRLELQIQVYGRDGTKIYDQRFDDIWRQSITSPPPLPFEPLPPGGSAPGLRGKLDFSDKRNSGLIPLI
ncbi:phage GP46 family protein [Bradyrhizobium tropiciagri]|uniref:phage GP46 family protein n=1 Tax=Bradyrhizobium tropiciagri TaxID=312253 RepID=UPI001BAA120D|nr:phage GP46 family protein [Bradyrhizobium tropiciagri]MBR0871207.1 phage GP46 family protein [Bradyrhizobium tropiciagri]